MCVSFHVASTAYPQWERHANVARSDGKRVSAMKSLLTMAVAAAAAILLGGCRDKKPEPVPGPQSALTVRVTAGELVAAERRWLFQN
jgi:hypothetical protein